jgi:trypsin
MRYSALVRMGAEVNRTIALRAAALLLSATGLLANAAPVAAIVNGELDGDRHPNVGVLAAVADGRLFAVCGGTLVSSTVFLTAGHCTAYLESLGIERAYVTFDSTARASSDFHAGTIYTNPRFNPGGVDRGDLGVVVFDHPVAGITPARLPRTRELDRLGRQTRHGAELAFTAVGYGAIGSVEIDGLRYWYTDSKRRYAVSGFAALQRSTLHLSQRADRGEGGTCYGDSGGPYFVDDSNLLGAITMTGDPDCAVTGVAYRIDTPPARKFLARFISLP